MEYNMSEKKYSMRNGTNKSGHTFHIPVMGLAFTIDTPVKVARFGITSVISIIEDRLIETMRKHYYESTNRPYFPISTHEPDYRAKRITDYLNLLNTIVDEQMRVLRAESFDPGSDIVKYFEILPNRSILKKLYHEMIITTDDIEKKTKQDYLRTRIVPGRIDANIMTKVDREHRDRNGAIVPDGSDAVAALRGYCNSSLNNSSIIFSAGLNPRLYNYLERLNTFDPDENFEFNRKVIVKVSDYRSALIQGKYLAKKGIWVSEFRIESGLNCGGHAFATQGYLLGPILEEFKVNRQELSESMFQIYKIAIFNKLGYNITLPHEIQISVQGGIGTHEENTLLHTYYDVASTGWGTPFLLVPEATTVDEKTLKLLSEAKENDIVLSNNSPLGVKFHYLKGTSGDLEKQARINSGKPGSPCTEKHLSSNTEFTDEPICTASYKYQKLKIEQLKKLQVSDGEFEKQKAEIQAKECLCVGLSNAASLVYDEPFLKKLKAVNICPGPNIANFSSIVSLQTMVDHIYGRTDILSNKERPHFFIGELNLYINYLKDELSKETDVMGNNKRKAYYNTFIRNLSEAILYYRKLAGDSTIKHNGFTERLINAEREIEAIIDRYCLC